MRGRPQSSTFTLVQTANIHDSLARRLVFAIARSPPPGASKSGTGGAETLSLAADDAVLFVSLELAPKLPLTERFNPLSPDAAALPLLPALLGLSNDPRRSAFASPSSSPPFVPDRERLVLPLPPPVMANIAVAAAMAAAASAASPPLFVSFSPPDDSAIDPGSISEWTLSLPARASPLPPSIAPAISGNIAGLPTATPDSTTFSCAALSVSSAAVLAPSGEDTPSILRTEVLADSVAAIEAGAANVALIPEMGLIFVFSVAAEGSGLDRRDDEGVGRARPRGIRWYCVLDVVDESGEGGTPLGPSLDGSLLVDPFPWYLRRFSFGAFSAVREAGGARYGDG